MTSKQQQQKQQQQQQQIRRIVIACYLFHMYSSLIMPIDILYLNLPPCFIQKLTEKSFKHKEGFPGQYLSNFPSVTWPPPCRLIT